MDWSTAFDRLSVGQRFAGAQRTVRDNDVIVFCALTGDWHPQHCDPDWAATSPFGGRIAHGLLTLSLAVGLAPLDPERVLALRRISDVVFKRSVHLDETISLEGELTTLQPIDEHTGLVGFTWEIRNQDRALVCRAKVQLLWRRDGRSQNAEAPAFWHDAMLGEASQGGLTPLPL
jgi:acyl dehydratase